jgi:hypothetical protein
MVDVETALVETLRLQEAVRKWAVLSLRNHEKLRAAIRSLPKPLARYLSGMLPLQDAINLQHSAQRADAAKDEAAAVLEARLLDLNPHDWPSHITHGTLPKLLTIFCGWLQDHSLSPAHLWQVLTCIEYAVHHLPPDQALPATKVALRRIRTRIEDLVESADYTETLRQNPAFAAEGLRRLTHLGSFISRYVRS